MNTLHKLFVGAAMMLSGAVSAFAAEPLSEILSKASAGKLLKADFSCIIKAKKQTYSSNGTIKFQDGAYALETDALVVIDNKEDSWTVDMVAKEVVVESSAGISMLKGATITPSYDSNGKLTRLEAILKDGTKASVLITQMKLQTPVDIRESFNYDHQSLDSSWVVTDLR